MAVGASDGPAKWQISTTGGVLVKVEAEKTLANGKLASELNSPRENQSKVGWCPALLGSECDVENGPHPPKLEMPECSRTQVSTKP